MGSEAERIVAELGLVPLPDEGGMWSQSWLDEHCSAIYFVLQPDDFSAIHRLGGTELWHHYAGAPAQLLLLGPGDAVSRPVLGPDLAAGQRPLVAVPSGVWMGAATTGDWSLVGTTMAPPFDESTFELGDAEALTAEFPSAAAEIAQLCRPVANPAATADASSPGDRS